MFDIAGFFISTAQAADTVAQEAASAVVVGDSNVWVRFAPLFLIFVVFYVLLIRPQQKKLDEQAALLKGLKKGDKVITSGGLVAVIAKVVDDEYVLLDLAKDVQVKAVKATISSLVKEPDETKKNETKKN